MNKILNPFDYLSNGKAFGWGLFGSVVAVALAAVALSLSPAEMTSIQKVVLLLSTNLFLWLPLSALLYVAALLFSSSRIRAVDIFATNLFALLPTTVICGVSNLVSAGLQTLVFEPGSVADILTSACYDLVVILLSVSMVWSMVWGCFAYFVSANLKGWKGINIFIVCYVFVSVVLQLLIKYI